MKIKYGIIDLSNERKEIDMAKFWIDYSESVLIEAENKEEAETLFWSGNYKALKHSDTEIDWIGEEEEDD